MLSYYSEKPQYLDFFEALCTLEKTLPISLELRGTDLVAYAKKLYQNAQIFTCRDVQHQIVAVAALYANDLNSRTAFLSFIAVAPAHQRQGVGKHLLTACENFSLCSNMRQLQLEVFSSNRKALAFYRADGYTVFRTLPDSLILAKELNDVR